MPSCAAASRDVGVASAPLTAAASTVEVMTSEIHANAQRMRNSTGHECRPRASAYGHDPSEHQNWRD